MASIRFLGELLPGHWISPWVGRTDPEQWLSGLFQIPQPRLRFEDLALQAQMGMSPSGLLDGQDWSPTMARGVGMAYKVLAGSPEVQSYLLPGPCAGRTACGL